MPTNDQLKSLGKLEEVIGLPARHPGIDTDNVSDPLGIIGGSLPAEVTPNPFHEKKVIERAIGSHTLESASEDSDTVTDEGIAN